MYLPLQAAQPYAVPASLQPAGNLPRVLEVVRPRVGCQLLTQAEHELHHPAVRLDVGLQHLPAQHGDGVRDKASITWYSAILRSRSRALHSAARLNSSGSILEWGE